MKSFKNPFKISSGHLLNHVEREEIKTGKEQRRERRKINRKRK